MGRALMSSLGTSALIGAAVMVVYVALWMILTKGDWR